MVKKIESDFRKNGVSIPAKSSNGDVIVSGYRIVRQDSGYYDIVDITGNNMVSNLNLPQTAVLLANDLSLGRFVNRELVQTDRNYGYMQFERSVCKKSQESSKSRNDYDRVELLEDKYNIASVRAEALKNTIDGEYKKLQNRLNNLITTGN